MEFSGYREDRRGNWFGGGTQMVYMDESTEPEFYIVNEQESQIIRIREEQQIKMLSHCMYGPQLKRENIDWLIHKAQFKYYDSVDEYITKTASDI
ncbi:hypothetical protein [Paenibacillus durus]|uniref:Uncharacterized protein n=1 Tax=Paenibacillus durus ATCC 35681 TaxID=1333534 RepID=A0A0F7FCI7_PAEDU|nr:hypothetical protein [Paenibacillus durus]AKG36109.1 hypothetical protein VK70_17365 [Paenibacillus durus ATCC 35681]